MSLVSTDNIGKAAFTGVGCPFSMVKKLFPDLLREGSQFGG
jgi:hypothetical protein